jgi:hypothetical protein
MQYSGKDILDAIEEELIFSRRATHGVRITDSPADRELAIRIYQRVKFMTDSFTKKPERSVDSYKEKRQRGKDDYRRG